MAKSKGGLSVRASDIINILNGDHLSSEEKSYDSTNLIGLAFKMDDDTNREYVDVKICSVHYVQNMLYAVEVPNYHDVYAHRKGYDLRTELDCDVEDCFFEYDFLMNRHDIEFGFGYVGRNEIEMLTNFLNPQNGEDDKRILILGAKTDFGNQAEEDHYFTFMLDSLPHDHMGELPVDSNDQMLGVPAWLNAIPCPPVWRTDDVAESEYEAGASGLNTAKQWRLSLKNAVIDATSVDDFTNIIDENANAGVTNTK